MTCFYASGNIVKKRATVGELGQIIGKGKSGHLSFDTVEMGNNRKEKNRDKNPTWNDDLKDLVQRFTFAFGNDRVFRREYYNYTPAPELT